MIWNQTKPPLGAKINWSHPLSKGIVSCWLFNEGMGDKVYDISGNGNYAVMKGFSNPPTSGSGWNPGKFGKCLIYDGTNDYVEAITQPYFLGPKSWEAYIRPNAIRLDDAIFSTGGEGSTKYGDFISMKGDGKIRWWTVRISSYIEVAISTTPMVTGNYYHIVCTWDGSYYRIYINGRLDYTSTLWPDPETNPPAHNLIIGGWKWGSTYYGFFSGKYEFARMWKRALSPSEVLQLYTEPFCMFND